MFSWTDWWSCLTGDGRISESSCSDSMFVVQDGSCSDGGSGTPVSDRASLICVELQNLDSPEQDQDQHSQEAQDKCVKDDEEVESGSVAEVQQTQTKQCCCVNDRLSHAWFLVPAPSSLLDVCSSMAWRNS